MDVEDFEGDGEVSECENAGNEADCNGDGAARGTPSKGGSGEETPIPPPAVGMVFPSMEAIDTYYRSYGFQQGFAVVRAASSPGDRGKEESRGQPRYTTWTCDHYGRPHHRRKINGKKQVVTDTQIKKNTAARTSKKCECPAMIYAGVNGDEWQLRKVVNEHKNHNLLSKGRFLAVVKKQEMVRAARRKANQIYNMLVKETNGLDENEMSISEQDPTNRASHNHGLDYSHGANQRTLPEHVPFECNLVNNDDSIPMATQRYRDVHRVQEHSDDANDECTLPTIVQLNDCPRTFVVKATYKDDLVKVDYSLRYSIDLLKELIGRKLNLEVGKFKMKYQDEDKDWVLVACVSDLKDAWRVSQSSGSNVVRLPTISIT